MAPSLGLAADSLEALLAQQVSFLEGLGPGRRAV